MENKKCPNCNKKMIKIAGTDTGYVDSSLDDKWECTNPECGHIETKSYFDKMCEQQYGKKI